ncbi:bifunctional biotin--[acetyl-CoA-carboxylase] ligase/biotin operon repressor BirA [Thalassotalea atypica]|uniref:bifunctional biotin--[acetyl-CoA-carboxylase] ligase/biotin operon repressor BirA n=1 Tax=Thalassotalea atypica TaxID=2054316 RepID=UPI002572891E|nr:bifunctional biotin--[acetyl-CoA-carboxylase] ligase/biotin operon repressor BirA [Thalassotalea atypica]
MAKSIKEHLIKELASGTFVSGQELADKFGVSRAAISNQVSNLGEMGLDIFKVRGKGYQLAVPIELLDKQVISAYLKEFGLENTVEVHNVIDSTNNYLMRKLPNQLSSGQICLAEYQQSGRGRRGRQWLSPFGSHLYLSMYQPLEQGMSQAMGLSLLTALAVKDSISALFSIEVGLKWPNDIYVQGEKIAGILIDLEGQATGSCHSIIGLGVNVNMPVAAAKTIDQPWTDLSLHVATGVDRNLLAATLIFSLNKRMKQYKSTGLKAMLDDWHQSDIFLNKPIKLVTGNNEIFGTCRGINEQGALLLDDGNEVRTVFGGEVSVRGVS